MVERDYAQDMRTLHDQFVRSERDMWGNAEISHYWAAKGVSHEQLAQDAGIKLTHIKDCITAWEVFGPAELRLHDEESKELPFTAHLFLAKTNQDRAVRLMAEAELSGRPVTSLYRSLPNAMLAEVAEKHADTPENVVAVERAAEKLANNPHLGEKAREYAQQVRRQADERQAQRSQSRDQFAPLRQAATTVGATFIGNLLAQVRHTIEQINEHDGEIGDFEVAVETLRLITAEFERYAGRRQLTAELDALLRGA